MADSGLLISWGDVYPGRDEQAVRLWTDANAYFGSLLEADRITRFEPFVAASSAGLRGFMIIGGAPEQIGAFMVDDEFARVIVRLRMCCKDVGVSGLFFGEELAHQMELWEHEVSALA